MRSTYQTVGIVSVAVSDVHLGAEVGGTVDVWQVASYVVKARPLSVWFKWDHSHEIFVPGVKIA